ncbi:MAG: DUF5916 domain-containing protein [Gemmatimonadota bacterium]
MAACRAPAPFAVVLCAFAAMAPPASAQEAPVGGERDLPQAPSYEVRQAGSPLDVDGVLDEPAWVSADPIPLDWEWSPGDNVEPPVESVCRITFDDANLYIGCLARDPDPDAIRAYLTDRDQGFVFDQFTFLIDPFHDQRRAFEFRVTALGVQADAILSPNEGIEDFSWDAIWDSAARITGEGYVVEAGIPFKSLRFPRTEAVQTWGFILERSYPRTNRHRMTSGPRDRDNNCLLCQANEITGFRGIAPGIDLQLTPTLTAARTDRREDLPDGDLEFDDGDAEAGLTASWGITPSLSLGATLNPDFSQVEADAAQLEVNQRFALFFPEKRPFFLEGADFFQVPGDLVFTRTVANPDVGLKVTGKEGPHAVGAFATLDRLNNLIFPGSQESEQTSLDQDVTGVVARYRQDVGEASTLGAAYTGREAEGYHNRLVAADGFLRLTPTQSASFLVAGTTTDYPDSVAVEFDQNPRSFEGLGYVVEYDYESRDWNTSVDWTDVGDDFRADFGFVPQVGFRGPEVDIARVFWSDGGGWFNRISLGAEVAWQEDQDGDLLERRYELALNYDGPLQSSLRAWTEWSRVAFAGRLFDLVQPRLSLEVRPTGWLGLDLFASGGHEIDFDNVRRADEIFLNPSVDLRIGRPLEISLDHTYQRLSLDDERILTANLTELRALYHFNVRTFVRAIVQLRDNDFNPAMFAEEIEPEEQRVFSQLLFSYKLNPQTVIFVGYSDNYQGTSEFDLTQSDRTFFFKVGYAWRL